MLTAALSWRRAALAAAAVALLFVATTLLLLGRGSEPAGADVNPNQNICKGGITKGEADPDDPTLAGVMYRIRCEQPITGYSIFVDGHPVQLIETEVFGTDAKTKGVVAADAFSCNGQIPGYGVNCVGTYRGFGDVLQGQFWIEGPLCREPRANPILTVATASVDSKGKPVQAIAGPFDLGRPRNAGCKPTRFSGKTKIPAATPDQPVLQ